MIGSCAGILMMASSIKASSIKALRSILSATPIGNSPGLSCAAGLSVTEVSVASSSDSVSSTNVLKSTLGLSWVDSNSLRLLSLMAWTSISFTSVTVIVKVRLLVEPSSEVFSIVILCEVAVSASNSPATVTSPVVLSI